MNQDKFLVCTKLTLYNALAVFKRKQRVMFSLYTDGGARGNPGIAGYGCALFDENGKLVDVDAKYLGIKTNNQAEYEGIIAGLVLVRKYGAKAVQCYLDSELIVKQVNGEYKVRNGNIKPLFDKLVQEIKKLEEVTFSHVLRKDNKIADKLVNIAIDSSLHK